MKDRTQPKYWEYILEDDEVYIRFSKLKDDEVKAICEILKKHKDIKILNLFGCEVTGNGIKLICESLIENNTITDLNLSSNNIGNDGAQYLSEFLKRNQSLISLDLFNNRIDHIGVKYLQDSLLENRTLTTLGLVCNGLSFPTVEELNRALKMNYSLTELNVNDGYIQILAEELSENRSGRKRIKYEVGHLLLLGCFFDKDCLFHKDKLSLDIFKIIFRLCEFSKICFLPTKKLKIENKN